MDLPVWQDLSEELHPKGIEFVSVCIDTAGAEAARPFVEAAKARHPSLVDEHHLVAEQLGVVNIPNGVWIDEDGVIVRPAEPAFVQGREANRARSSLTGGEVPEHMREIFGEASKIRIEPDKYVAALRDWVDKGKESPYALPPDEVVARSRPRPPAVAEAAAHFELATHLWQEGQRDAAVEHFRQAHRLQPDNFSYKRQAWSLATPGAGGPFERYWQGPAEGQDWPYESDWLSEVRSFGAENYYPKLEM